MVYEQTRASLWKWEDVQFLIIYSLILGMSERNCATYQGLVGDDPNPTPNLG